MNHLIRDLHTNFSSHVYSVLSKSINRITYFKHDIKWLSSNRAIFDLCLTFGLPCRWTLYCGYVIMSPWIMTESCSPPLAHGVRKSCDLCVDSSLFNLYCIQLVDVFATTADSHKMAVWPPTWYKMYCTSLGWGIFYIISSLYFHILYERLVFHSGTCQVKMLHLICLSSKKALYHNGSVKYKALALFYTLFKQTVVCWI